MLEDIGGAVQGDQIAGCSVETARTAVRALAAVHAPVLGDNALGAADYLNQPNPLTSEMLKALLAGLRRSLRRPGGARSTSRSAAGSSRCWDRGPPSRRPPLGLVHGDYRLDNLLFEHGCMQGRRLADDRRGERRCSTLSTSSGRSLRVEDRRAHERELVHAYHDELVGRGREHALVGALLGGVSPAGASPGSDADRRDDDGRSRTERGDEMFMTWLARNAQQILDLDALSLLPEPSSAPVVPLRPEPDDEGRTTPGPEALWNESWYFDAVSDDEHARAVRAVRPAPEPGDLPVHRGDLRPGAPVGDGRRSASTAARARRRLAGDQHRCPVGDAAVPGAARALPRAAARRRRGV